jgi:hypothetical protein
MKKSELRQLIREEITKLNERGIKPSDDPWDIIHQALEQAEDEERNFKFELTKDTQIEGRFGSSNISKGTYEVYSEEGGRGALRLNVKNTQTQETETVTPHNLTKWYKKGILKIIE